MCRHVVTGVVYDHPHPEKPHIGLLEGPVYSAGNSIMDNGARNSRNWSLNILNARARRTACTVHCSEALILGLGVGILIFLVRQCGSII